MLRDTGDQSLAELAGFEYPLPSLYLSVLTCPPCGSAGLRLPCFSHSLYSHLCTGVSYLCWRVLLCDHVIFRARCIRAFGSHSALKGITFLSLFIYKYIADTAFVFVSCIETDIGLVSELALIFLSVCLFCLSVCSEVPVRWLSVLHCS